jgi:uncharacterized membrane protein
MSNNLPNRPFARELGIGLIVTILVIGVALLLPPAGKPKMPAWALTLHLATVIPALFLGAWVLYAPKGTPAHKMLGKIWVVLMFTTAFASAFIQSWGRFSPIHIFSVWTPISLALGIAAARRGDIKAHLNCMRGAYIGLVIAGVLAAALPGRFLWRFFAGLFA